MKLYTKKVCGQCLYVKSELKAKGLEYEEINLDENEEEKNKMIDRNLLSAPILEVEGEFINDTKAIIDKIGQIEAEEIA